MTQNPIPEMPPRLRRWRVNILAVTWLSYAGYYFCRKTFGIVKKPLRDHLWPEDALWGTGRGATTTCTSPRGSR